MDSSDYPVSGWNYVVTGDSFNQSVKTGADGTETLSLKPGQYQITELSNNCWTAINTSTQIVNVKPAETAQASFGNIAQVGLNILAYQDINGNKKYDVEEGIQGVNFVVSGSQENSTLTSGKDGSVKFAGLPGTYTIRTDVPEGWNLISENPQTETLGACEDKQVEFEFAPIPIKINDLVPRDNDVIGTRNVTFAWRTSESSSSELYLKGENESAYNLTRGPSGFVHSINTSNLTRNTCYNFKVRSEKGSRYVESMPRRFCVDNGIIFIPNSYNLTVERDYDQHRPIYVKNTDSKPHSIKVNITNMTNSYDDIYLGFLGEGSMDRELNLAPGETKNLDLAIHAQDAMHKNYTFAANLTNLGPEKIVDYAQIKVNVHFNETDFKFEEIGLDPINLTKTFRVTNLKDPVRDLTITPDDNLRKDVVIQPYVNHASLERDGSIEFTVSPLWSRDIGAILGFLTASAGTAKKVLPVNFSCQEGNQLYQVTLYNPCCISIRTYTSASTLNPRLRECSCCHQGSMRATCTKQK